MSSHLIRVAFGNDPSFPFDDRYATAHAQFLKPNEILPGCSRRWVSWVGLLNLSLGGDSPEHHPVLFSFLIRSESSNRSFQFEPLSVLLKRAGAKEDEQTIILCMKTLRN